MKKTALVLSGGGSRGAYEIGVWKALKKLHKKINIVTGTSVGAINSAMIAQGSLKLSEQLWLRLETDMVFDIGENERQNNGNQQQDNQQKKKNKRKGKKSCEKKLPTELSHLQKTLQEKLSTIDIGGMPAEDALIYAKEMVMSGGAGSGGLRNLLQEYVDETKVRSSEIDYGLVTTEFPTFNGHFLYVDDIPQGKLIDYILASASCFPAVQKCVIDDKQFIDGGYKDNMPVEMAMKKGATSIIAVDLQAAGFIRKDIIEKAKQTAEEFHLIKSSLDLGNFLIFDKQNTSRIITLGYLDTMREFGRYDGKTYTFKKRQLDSRELLGAESIAAILELDATKIYTKRIFNEEVKSALPSKEETIGDIRDFLAHLAANLSDAKLHTQLLIYIARDLKTERENSPFLQPKLFKILEHEILAANYLLRQNLL